MVLDLRDAGKISNQCSAIYQDAFNDISIEKVCQASLPTIAVCIPNYNNYSILETVIKSILNQKKMLPITYI